VGTTTQDPQTIGARAIAPATATVTKAAMTMDSPTQPWQVLSTKIQVDSPRLGFLGEERRRRRRRLLETVQTGVGVAGGGVGEREKEREEAMQSPTLPLSREQINRLYEMEIA